MIIIYKIANIEIFFHTVRFQDKKRKKVKSNLFHPVILPNRITIPFSCIVISVLGSIIY